MGAHAAPSVRRGPSSSPSSTSTILVLLLAFSFLTSTCNADTVSESLLKFKSALTNADALSSWNSSTTPCGTGSASNWRGVQCFRGEVYGLQLENMKLSGQIDVDSLVNISTLRSLSFMGNDFKGPMPDWSKLGALKALYLNKNQFSGKIPDDTFKGMHSLKKVFLGNNKFTGNLPTSLSSPKLVELGLENNQFTGFIPDFPSSIQKLNMSNNLFDGPIPESLKKIDPKSFSGNKGLCGKPVGSDCSIKTPLDESPSPTSPTSPNSPPSPPSAAPTQAPQQQTAQKESTDNKTSVVKIVMIVICSLVALAAIILIVIAIIRSKREKPQYDETAAYNQKNLSPSDVHSVAVVPRAEPTGKGKKAESGKLSFVREDRERFDLQDLLRASAEVLGSGNFGSSYKAVLMDGQEVVVKRFKQMTCVGKEDFHEHMRRLGRLRHPNLLPLVAYYYRKEEKLLVSDYVNNGSLAGRLHGKHSVDKPGLDWPTRLKIVKGVSRGLLYLQDELPSLTVPHAHLKSSNVLLDKACNPLLMDYSLIPVVNPSQVQNLLMAYKSPEYAQHKRTTKRTDVWCLGILILEILTGQLPEHYLAQRAAYGADLAGWVNPIIREESPEVFDKEMANKENSEGEMLKLLRIAAACCEEEPENRLDLKEAVERIEELKEMDN